MACSLKSVIVVYSLAKDFTIYPGPRFRRQGNYSGEEFREDFLKSWLEAAKRGGYKIVIDLDGVMTLPFSFLEEAFGGMQRLLNKSQPHTKLTDFVDWISDTDPLIVDDVLHFVEKAYVAVMEKNHR